MSAIAEMVGIAMGSAAASYVAAWQLLVKPQEKKLDKKLVDAVPDQSVLATQIKNLESGVDDLEAVVKEHKQSLEKQIDDNARRLEQRVNRAEDNIGKMVTTEEFSAQVQITTKSVEGLTEKVGNATGAIEAWTRMSNRR